VEGEVRRDGKGEEVDEPVSEGEAHDDVYFVRKSPLSTVTPAISQTPHEDYVRTQSTLSNVEQAQYT